MKGYAIIKITCFAGYLISLNFNYWLPKKIAMSSKILGVIDEDPFNPQTWSGSSLYFFNSLQSNNALYTAISATPSKRVQLLYKTLSFHPNIQNWKFKYHLNTSFFNQMTKAAEDRIATLNPDNFDTILQVGAWYNFTNFQNKTFASYHDGNLATRLNSPYGYPNIQKKYIEKAFRYERELYEQMDFIFPMSKWLAHSFINDFKIDAAKVIPVGAGINLPRVNDPIIKNPDKPKILFVGKDFERKGGHVLLDAFRDIKKKIKNVELIIVGPINIQDLPEGVRCEGFISKNSDEGMEKLLTLYSEASIFVLPSLYEPFGIAFAEAMAHKLPCIGTNNCAMPEIIDNGINGFIVEPNNSKLLADRIYTLLEDHDLRESMSESAYNKYYTNYRWEIVTKKIINVLNGN
jgi:glycosyltransferase involved in cell wall biosynthesis